VENFYFLSSSLTSSKSASTTSSSAAPAPSAACLLIHRFSQFMGSLGEFLTHAFNLISILSFHGLSQRGSRFFYFGFRFAINFIAEFLD
jgi:hypothetical protein